MFCLRLLRIAKPRSRHGLGGKDIVTVPIAVREALIVAGHRPRDVVWGVKSRAWMTNLMVYVNRRLLGQQRDKLYREALRLVLAEDPDIPPPRVTAADGPMKRLRAIARVHVKKAEEGDMQAIKDLADRLDGKPAQMLEHAEP